MKDRIIILASSILVIFFFIGGLLDILNHFLSKTFLFVGFLVIILYIIFIKAREEHDDFKDDENLS
jgi:hypothetical protein